MKTCSLWSLCLLFLLGFMACDRVLSLSSTLRRATGWPFEVVVVMDKVAWHDESGELLRAQLQVPVPSLPQAEPSMRITYIEPAQFNGLFKTMRNVLWVSLDAARYTQVNFSVEENRWAKGQCLLMLHAPNEQQLAAYLLQHNETLVERFSLLERKRWIQALNENFSLSVKDSLLSRFGCSLHVPKEIRVGKVSDQFLWASNQANRGRMDLIAYTFPYTTPEAFSETYLVAKRDSVLRQQIPGSFPGSYMQTERRFGLCYTPMLWQDTYCGMLRGLWRVEGDMMGGPFVSLARLDPSGKRVIVVEGFVYAPESKKANLIRRMEAALFTLSLNN